MHDGKSCARRPDPPPATLDSAEKGGYPSIRDILFEPLDFIARLAALVPRPRVNLTRFHGVFAPNSHWRAQITPAGRDRERRSLRADETPSAGEPYRARSWAQRLKRVFNIGIKTCGHCGGPMKVIASIEDPAVIKTILAHLDKTTSRMPARRVLPPAARRPALCDRI